MVNDFATLTRLPNFNPDFAYTMPADRICGTCKHWKPSELLEGFGDCNNPEMTTYVQGGLIDPVSSVFGCVPLWEAIDSDGEGA